MFRVIFGCSNLSTSIHVPKSEVESPNLERLSLSPTTSLSSHPSLFISTRLSAGRTVSWTAVHWSRPLSFHLALAETRARMRCLVIVLFSYLVPVSSARTEQHEGATSMVHRSRMDRPHAEYVAHRSGFARVRKGSRGAMEGTMRRGISLGTELSEHNATATPSRNLTQPAAPPSTSASKIGLQRNRKDVSATGKVSLG